MIQAFPVSQQYEIDQILEMQQRFLRGKTSLAYEEREGFLTVCHNAGLLQQMHALEPSIIAADNGVLAGYALVMAKSCRQLVPELVPMFDVFNEMEYRGRPINDYGYYVMGQICVDKPYRGQGVFDLLYSTHRDHFAHRYDFVVTEISTRNFRSLRAHERVGFKPVHIYRDHLDEWLVVIWDWK